MEDRLSDLRLKAIEKLPMMSQREDILAMVAELQSRRSLQDEGGGWQPIESAPKEEGPSFLIRTHAFGGRETVIIQVSRFEERLYPDALGAAIDWESAITHAKYWMPLPAGPVGSSAPSSAGSMANNPSSAGTSQIK